MEWEKKPNGATVAVGCPLTPQRDFVLVVEYGQPDKIGSIVIPMTEQHGRYALQECRYGEVVGVGPGRYAKDGRTRVPMPDELTVGSVVIFSKKFGSRTPHMYRHEKWGGDMFVRIFDVSQILAVADGFVPDWDVIACQRDPGLTMSG
jgi:co-chaperonin GroES (HSP10)